MDPATGLTDGAARRTRLDRATLTVSVHPDAGEACVIVGHVDPRYPLRRRPGIRGEAGDPARSAQSAAARRRTKVRRWCRAHRATRLATLTFAVEPTLDDGWKAVEALRKRLRAAGFDQLLVVPEYGEKNGRLHFHAALGRYVPKRLLEECWGKGFVEVRMLKPSTKRHTTSQREQAGIVAGYLSSYLTDEPGEAAGGAEAPRAVGFNRRRYSISKGTVPEVVRFVSFGLYEAWSETQRLCGHTMHEVWRSPTDDDSWRGPPLLLLSG